jgi:hypothetical protein
VLHHVYAYVGNSPLNLTDPFGLCALGPLCGVTSDLFNLIPPANPNAYAAKGAAAGGVAGAIVGGLSGGVGGGAGGTLVAPGVGTVGGAIGGGIEGATVGGATGATAGGAIGYGVGSFILYMQGGQRNQGSGGGLDSQLETAVQDELAAQGDLYAEAYSFQRKSGPTVMANLDPSLGPNQVRYFVNMLNEVTGEVRTFSVNYDPETGLTGIIKPSSGPGQ